MLSILFVLIYDVLVPNLLQQSLAHVVVEGFNHVFVVLDLCDIPFLLVLLFQKLLLEHLKLLLLEVGVKLLYLNILHVIVVATTATRWNPLS